ncbi:MAG: T9SS type A sorting domain-containing protein [Bacteroidota bacterium]
MRILLLALLFSYCTSSYGQLLLQPLSKQHSSQLVFNANDLSDATLPFWDDFAATADGLPKPIESRGGKEFLQWSDSTRGVFVNSTLAINPPSYKAITFDGLNSNGQVYEVDGRGKTDELRSAFLDLSAFSAEDEIYLSFFWQGGGNVERPDKQDSIRLQFFNKTASGSEDDKWESVWSKVGIDDFRSDVFYQDSIRLSGRFISDSTQFRFQSFGDKDGPFDAWHLDWIYLDSARANDPLTYFDRGLTGQLTSPFSPFKSLPTHQLKAGGITEGTQEVQLFNLQKTNFLVELAFLLKDAGSMTVYDSTGLISPLLPAIQDPFIVDNIVKDSAQIELLEIPVVDSLVVSSLVYVTESDDDFLPNTDIALRINDTIRTDYLLHNYYAFDDGSAEYAVGLNRPGDQLAIQYWLNEPDTLTHIDIYFPNIAPDSDGESLTLRVFKRLDDDGLIRSESIIIQTASQLDQFTSYELARPLILSDTFFISYEQNVNRYIGVGLDRSNDEASRYIFQNVSGDWERNDRIQGAVMMRPVFKNVGADFTLSADVPPVTDDLVIYPNPTEGLIRILGSYDRIELRDLSGHLLVDQPWQEKHDFSALAQGLYLLTVYRDDVSTIKKIRLK